MLTYVYFGDSTQLLYLRARMYSPGIGRFLTKDTWAGIYTEPITLNRWAYVRNNPVLLTDPSGHCDILCILAILAALGLLTSGCSPVSVATPTSVPYIIPGLKVRYENQLDFSQQEQGWIYEALSNWGNLIGVARFASLVEQGAKADGNMEILIKYNTTGSGGAGFDDRKGFVYLGDDVFSANNWANKFRPDPVYQNQAASARISVAHEFAHVIHNGDPTPVYAFDNLYDENNPLHATVAYAANEALANILAYMTEQGLTAPGIPSDLQGCVVNNLIPYYNGTSTSMQNCVAGSSPPTQMPQ